MPLAFAHEAGGECIEPDAHAMTGLAGERAEAVGFSVTLNPSSIA